MNEQNKMKELAGLIVEGKSSTVESIKRDANEFQRALNKFQKAINLHIDSLRNDDSFSPKEIKNAQQKADKAYDKLETAMDDFVEAAIS